MKKLFLSFLMMLTLLPLAAANKYDNPDTIVVSRDGTGEFRTIDEAIEVCRAFMDYSKVIYVKKGVYKEKLILPSWLTNITISYFQAFIPGYDRIICDPDDLGPDTGDRLAYANTATLLSNIRCFIEYF